MHDLDPHTQQINLWIALSGFEPTFSGTLGKVGYGCTVIEDEFYILDEEGEDVINPDLILSSESEEHALLIECKSLKINSDQIQRYLRVEGNESNIVLQGLINNISASDISAEVLLSSFDDLSGKDIPEEISIVHFRRDPGSGLSVWNLDENKIKEPSASAVFPINHHPNEPLPSGHYPFDIYESDKEAMVSAVFSSVISLAVQEGEIKLDDVLDRTHPYWDKIGDAKQKELSDRVERTFLELRKAGLDQYLKKIAGTNGKEWKVVSRTIQAVKDRTDFYIERTIAELPQARLDHDAWSANDTNDSDEDIGVAED
ncbi:hypothetical protein [Natronocalculus amylovorans]|uniref:Uncharacterized protein n=1 Tax=Natronocalculus amylovorans TaxID=2917812 RepID=A0AAE3FZE6_9EURY|nr:hypothetical protein [Natronocalculus amylovorans]MCL9818372.1 hypothetical protein [Natronocalculus amylovorans]